MLLKEFKINLFTRPKKALFYLMLKYGSIFLHIQYTHYEILILCFNVCNWLQRWWPHWGENINPNHILGNNIVIYTVSREIQKLIILGTTGWSIAKYKTGWLREDNRFGFTIFSETNVQISTDDTKMICQFRNSKL